MAGRRTYSEAEIQAIVRERVAERKEFVAEALESIRPELERVAEEIGAANHVKHELGGLIEDLTNEVRETNSKLERHISEDAHKYGTELIRDMGLRELSLAEKQAVRAVLGQAVDDGKRKGLLHNRTVQIGLVIAGLYQAFGIAAGLYAAFFGAAHPLRIWP